MSESNSNNKKFLERMIKCFRENSGFIMLFFFINFATLAWSVIHQRDFISCIEYGGTVFFFVSLFTLLCARIIPARLFEIAKKFAFAVCLIPFSVEIFLMLNYRALIGPGVVNATLETNTKEAVEFLKMYVTFREVIILFVIFLGIIIFAKKRVWERFRFPDKLVRPAFLVALIASFLCAIQTIVMLGDFVIEEMLPIQRMTNATCIAIDNMRAYHRLANMVSSDVKITENNSKIENIVFILGESTNRNHMHLYGYYLDNTPYLDDMAKNGEIAVYRDVISPHSTTVAVLSELFTFCNHESEQPWYEHRNLIDVMNAAGYSTHWLSNQESSGTWGSVAQVYANHSKMHEFTRIRDSIEDMGILDEELFPLLDEAMKNDDTNRNFYVLHLMGGHGLYYNRYPYIFNKFTGEDIHLNVSEQFRSVVAEYDNALFYNDYVVKSIIDRFVDKEAIVFYVPDHGEAVYDEGSVSGHIEENPNRHMIEIPMIIWASDSFKKKYPDKWEKIMSSVNRPYMTDDMIHTMLDIADIKTEEYDAKRSIVNDEFDASRPRIFNHLDYEKEIVRGKTDQVFELNDSYLP